MQLSIIIPTKLAHTYLQDCIKSIKKYTNINDYEILIIVNKDKIALNSEIKKLKKTKDKKIKIFWAKNDLGIAGAINKGLGMAQGKYIFITNDDIEIKEKNWFKKYKVFFDKYPCLGTIGFKGNDIGFNGYHKCISHLDLKLELLIKKIKKHYFVFKCKKIKNNETNLDYFRKDEKTKKEIPANKIAKYHERYWPKLTEVSFHHTCSIFSTKEKIKKAGGFDEIYWPYLFEDIDFGLTMLCHGYRHFRIPLRHIHYGDILGKSKSGGSTHNLIKERDKKRNIRHNVDVVKRIKKKFRRINFIKICPWRKTCKMKIK